MQSLGSLLQPADFTLSKLASLPSGGFSVQSQTWAKRKPCYQHLPLTSIFEPTLRFLEIQIVTLSSVSPGEPDEEGSVSLRSAGRMLPNQPTQPPTLQSCDFTTGQEKKAKGRKGKGREGKKKYLLIIYYLLELKVTEEEMAPGLKKKLTVHREDSVLCM